MFEADNTDDFTFKINEDYARKFEYNKKREDLHRLEEKYGKDVKNLKVKEDNDSTDTDEDDEAIYDSVSKDKNFLRVLSKLMSKDPEIYDKEKHWFGEDDEKVEVKSKEKPMYLKDYERETLLKKGSMLVDSDDEGPTGPTYTEEQQQLKDSLKIALQQDDDDEDILTLRTKTTEEKEKEEEDYRKWLKGEKSKLKDKSLTSDCKALRENWTDPQLDENEKFLRDFLLNKGWVEKEDEDFVPTYDEIVNDDEEEEEKHEKFERQFNFRFEEPDHDLIKQYPRTIANSVRKANEKRKDTRKRKEERKAKKMEEERKEIERLKKLKLEEIEKKIQKLSDNAGRDLQKSLKSTDLDEEFSPEQHDKMMSELFDDDYYNEKDAVKPVFSDSDDDLINEEEWYNKISEQNGNSKVADMDTTSKANGSTEPTIEEPTVIYRDEEDLIDEDHTSKKKSWKRKRSKKFKEAVVKPKPTFNPDENTFEKYFDEYYKLDCEDVIGDTHCRFGYRKTTPTTYGLTIDEIIMADDKELNQWFSFKKMMKYRNTHQEEKDLRKFNNQKHNEYMKRQLLPSLYTNEVEEAEEPATKKSKKKKDKTTKAADFKSDIETKKKTKKDKTTKTIDSKSDPETKKKKKEKVSQSRLEAYGLS